MDPEWGESFCAHTDEIGLFRGTMNGWMEDGDLVTVRCSGVPSGENYHHSAYHLNVLTTNQLHCIALLLCTKLLDSSLIKGQSWQIIFWFGEKLLLKLASLPLLKLN